MNQNSFPLIILVAPNVGEQMGGEAMKALQIFQQYKILHSNTIQLTHERNKSELKDRLQLDDVFFIKDDIIFLLLSKTVIFRLFIDTWFSKKAIKLAEKIAVERGFKKEQVIIHQTLPNSPVLPRAISNQFINVFGPINGNIYYPKALRYREKALVKLRRLFHFPLQKLNSLLPNGLKKADLIFVAGGNRTQQSLTAAACNIKTMVETIDCGIKDDFLNKVRVEHHGTNYHFIQFGRLVLHKGTFLTIKSLLKTKLPICIDIVGTGPDLAACKKLTEQLGLTDRVRFVDWYIKHSELFDSFAKYRGVLLPSLEDANGIVIQEAMALGLPPICLEWGGPQLLIDHNINGFLVNPSSEDFITSKLAEYMDKLAEDDQLAESLSLAARRKALTWRWSFVAKEWIAHYDLIMK
jgi:glycosyltransferase involved in cell wall biosynthesis